jgi:hypothetical protein
VSWDKVLKPKENGGIGHRLGKSLTLNLWLQNYIGGGVNFWSNL